MSFMIPCPHCGARDSDEFRYGGELRDRTGTFADDRAWADYVFGRGNLPGEQHEWWFHRLGCRRWFIAVRHLTTNLVLSAESAPQSITSADSLMPTP